MYRSHAWVWTAFLLLPAIGVSAQQPDAGRKEILAKLDSHSDIEFKQEPFYDALKHVGKLHSIDIRFDKPALEDEGIYTDNEITRQLTGCSLRAALRLMLEDLDLEYVVKDGYLLITSRASAEKQPFQMVYPVDEILDWDESAEARGLAAALIRTISTCIAPETWRQAGGQGTISLESARSGKSLAIEQVGRVHHQIHDLLARLRRLARARVEGTTLLPGHYLGASPAEMRIFEALNSPTEMCFIETPLTKVADQLGESHGIEVQVDYSAWRHNIYADMITCHGLKGVSLGSALRLALRRTGLAYVVRDDVLLLTAEKDANNWRVARIYPLDGLIEVDESPARWKLECDRLVKILTTTVAPPAWSAAGGKGTISVIPSGLARCLVVEQNSPVHAQIVDLLAKLRRLKHLRAAGITPSPGSYVGVSAMERKILEALQSPSEFEFIETPLADVVDYLKDVHKINIQVDDRALEAIAMGSDTPITLNIKGISLGCALRFMLRDMGLTYVVRDDVLLITTDKAANSRLVTRVYPLDGLVRVSERGGKRYLESDRLVKMLTSTVAPETWAESGGMGRISTVTRDGLVEDRKSDCRRHLEGERVVKILTTAMASETWVELGDVGTITVIPTGPFRCLLVRQTEPVHAQIVDILERLRIVVEGEAGQSTPNTIHAALNSPTTMEFVGTPLGDVVDYTKNLHNIEIQVCHRALEDAVMGTDTPITANLKDIRLADALRKMLGPLQLTYVAEDELLLITTVKDANSWLFARVYPLDMGTAVRIAPRDRLGGWKFEQTVAPKSWSRSGGSGSVALFSEGSTRALVIWQTGSVHEQLVPVLGQPVSRRVMSQEKVR